MTKLNSPLDKSRDVGKAYNAGVHYGFISCGEKILKIFNQAEDTIWLTKYKTFMDALIEEDIISQKQYENWAIRNSDKPEQKEALP